MITEDYVSFEVAKLLKEKGFDVYTSTRYDYDGGFHSRGDYLIGDSDISAPTHQMAMKWLREMHKVFFCVHPDYPISKDYMVEFYDEGRPSRCFGNYQTYEEAIESALKYLLENLI